MPGLMANIVLVARFWLSIRVLVIVSFIAHLALALLAGVRRRQATSVWTPILWMANQLARWAPITALGKLSVGSTPQEEELVTLWVAFMLLHTGRPDNITAYSLEDTVLSRRQKAEVWYQLFGSASPLPFLMKNFLGFSNGGDAMLRVSSVICVMSIVKYLEGAFFALSRGNLKNMRSTRKKNNKSPGRRNGLQIAERGGREPNDEQILLAAHDLLYITQDAFIDYLDDKNVEDADDEQEALPDTWDEKLYTVVNMELSLMYDLIYTKAAMVHTWIGYALRFASPIAGATAFVLFWFHSKEGQAAADVMITYVLLAGTVILDINWLLRAVASTWFYSFLNKRPRSWLHHALLCSEKWQLIRRLIVSDLNLFRFLVNNKKPTRYRMWSGTIGQYNLLKECTSEEDETTGNYLSSLLKWSVEDIWMEYKYHCLRGKQISRLVNEQLFRRIWENMKLAFQVPEPHAKMEPRKEPSPSPSGPPRDPNQEINIALDFTPDLQETILILHIATNIFYSCVESHKIEGSEWVEATKLLSDYMMCLVVVRPTMLPGLTLSSRYEAVLKALGDIWKDNKDPSLRSSNAREKRLAKILCDTEGKPGGASLRAFGWDGGERTEILSPGFFLSVLHNANYILSEGAQLAGLLLHWGNRAAHWDKLHITIKKKFKRQFPDLMEPEERIEMLQMPKDVTDAIFREWVRQLINVSIRCTRDSHAKQLGRGGELTTIVWILAEHARILRVKRSTQKKPANYDAPDIHVRRY